MSSWIYSSRHRRRKEQTCRLSTVQFKKKEKINCFSLTLLKFPSQVNRLLVTDKSKKIKPQTKKQLKQNFPSTARIQNPGLYIFYHLPYRWGDMQIQAGKLVFNHIRVTLEYQQIKMQVQSCTELEKKLNSWQLFPNWLCSIHFQICLPKTLRSSLNMGKYYSSSSCHWQHKKIKHILLIWTQVHSCYDTAWVSPTVADESDSPNCTWTHSETPEEAGSPWAEAAVAGK